MDNLNKLLSEIYYNIGGVASLSGVQAVHREAEKRLGRKIPQKLVCNWLNKQYVYKRHKRVRKPKGKRLPTVPIIRTNTGVAFDCDLAMFDKSRYKYSLICVDQMSHFGYAQPMVNKSAETTSKAMQKLIETQAKGKYPISVRTDRGQ